MGTRCGVPSEPMYVILPIPRASPYPGRCPGLVCPAPLGRWFVPTGHHIPATPWIPIPGGGREMVNPWAPRCSVPSEPMYVILSIPRAFPYPGRCPGLVCPAPLGRWFVPTGHRISVQPWEPCQANPRVLKERCISPNGEPAPDLTRCGVPSEPMYVILSIPRASMHGSVGAENHTN